jgi:putative DNA methylase
MVDYNFQLRGEKSDFGWYSRGYVPHFDGGEVSQFVTFRLCDSMPQEVLSKWRKESSSDADVRRKIEGYLDSGYGECWLRDRRIATIVQNSLKYYDQTKYKLIAWVVMPNHVHFLITVLPDVHLDDLFHSIKSFTAHEANKILNRIGQFWQREAFDRYIRDCNHFTNVIDYIENNPVKAGLCNSPDDWEFSSAFNGPKRSG